MTIENIYILMLLVILAVWFVWITVATIVAIRRGERVGKALKVWARGVVEIISGLG